MASVLEYVWFGDRLLCRVDSCPKCGQPSWVEDFRTTCCDGEVQFVGARTRREALGSGQRRSPSLKVRHEVLAKQANRCYYCEFEFGTVYLREGKERVRRLNWDHFIPFAYLQTNPTTNWVAACSLCNGIKHDRIFYDRDEARRVISTEAIARHLSFRPDTVIA